MKEKILKLVDKYIIVHDVLDNSSIDSLRTILKLSTSFFIGSIFLLFLFLILKYTTLILLFLIPFFIGNYIVNKLELFE